MNKSTRSQEIRTGITQTRNGSLTNSLNPQFSNIFTQFSSSERLIAGKFFLSCLWHHKTKLRNYKSCFHTFLLHLLCFFGSVSILIVMAKDILRHFKFVKTDFRFMKIGFIDLWFCFFDVTNTSYGSYWFSL